MPTNVKPRNKKHMCYIGKKNSQDLSLSSDCWNYASVHSISWTAWL